MTACKSCGAHVVWGMTEDRKFVPFQADPDGDWIVTPDGDAVRAGMFDDGQRYASHFAICPDAEEWRRVWER